MKVLIVDNHDSFTYNLLQLVEQSGCDEVNVIKNDLIDLDVSGFDKIIFSPGPGVPSEEAGLMKKILQQHSANKSILGVCLGHQAIAEYFGAKLGNPEKVYHGIKAGIKIADTDEYLFRTLPAQIHGGLYHSWYVSPDNLPDCLKITAISDEGIIMAIAHETYDIRGLQFHPESVMTEHGNRIIKNWLLF